MNRAGARDGGLLIEAIFALFLLGVAGLASLALLAQALRHFEEAEARGRAASVASGWLTDPIAIPREPFDVGAGTLHWIPERGVEFRHARGGVWRIPAPPRGSGDP